MVGGGVRSDATREEGEERRDWTYIASQPTLLRLSSIESRSNTHSFEPHFTHNHNLSRPSSDNLPSFLPPSSFFLLVLLREEHIAVPNPLLRSQIDYRSDDLANVLASSLSFGNDGSIEEEFDMRGRRNSELRWRGGRGGRRRFGDER